jgi:putative colanic acid biosynthesis acetyltransferase WcaF
VRLDRYDQRDYHPGAGVMKRVIWYLVNAFVFASRLFPFSAPKRSLLRLFGARVGRGVVIKPRVNIKYPWHLGIGDYVWLGEGVWLDSLARITIGDHVCISQDAYLVTGNHDYRDVHFGLMVQGIVIEEGSWIGARAVVCPGSRVGREVVLTAGSTLRGVAEPGGIYQGNPATRARDRYSPRVVNA